MLNTKTPCVGSFRIAARGLIVENNQLLFVSNDGEYWYLPGGQLELNEDLPSCVEREVFEETGLAVRVGKLLHVLECNDVKANIHRVHFYFETEKVKGQLNPAWTDEGGIVQYHRFFSLAQIQADRRLLPRFLSLGTWLPQAKQHTAADIYQGLVYMQGFELVAT
jgi:ADP-ribose pyrophosphatase YjhB (NUDIX family)